MRGKLVLLVGVGIGYVLGARAGRERYEEIKRSFRAFWNDPRVQHQVRNVEDFAKDKAPDVVDFLSDSAKKVVTRKNSGTATRAAGGSAVGGKASNGTSPNSSQPTPRKSTPPAGK